MAKETGQKKQDETSEIERTVDPYTGELKPVPEDADQFIEVVPEETDDRRARIISSMRKRAWIHMQPMQMPML